MIVSSYLGYLHICRSAPPHCKNLHEQKQQSSFLQLTVPPGRKIINRQNPQASSSHPRPRQRLARFGGMRTNHRGQPPLDVLRFGINAAVLCLMADARDHAFQVCDPRLQNFQPVSLFDIVVGLLPRFVSTFVTESGSRAGLIRECCDLQSQVQ